MTTQMLKFPWDDVPHFAPDWQSIKGKAAMYKTCRRRSDGKVLSIIGITRYADGELTEPLFMVRDEFGLANMPTNDLCSFVL